MGQALVGRRTEAAELEQAVSDGVPAVVVGGAGSGKSTFVARTLADLGVEPAIGVGVRMLRWRHLFALSMAIGHDLAPDDPVEVADVVLARLDGRPLVIEDLQWVDGDTLAVLPRLAGACPLVLTARSGTDVVASMTASLGACRHIDLGPLSVAEAEELVRAVAPDLPGPLVGRIAEASGGVPVVAEQLALAGGAVPSDLADRVGAAMAELPDQTRWSLARVAIADGPVEAAALDGLDELLAARLVTAAGDGVRIAAPVLAEAVVEQLAAADRDHLHLEVALAAEDPGVAARHLLAAGHRAEAFDAVLEALRAPASDVELADHLWVAASCAPPEQRVRATLGAATAATRVHEPERVLELLGLLPDGALSHDERAGAEMLRALALQRLNDFDGALDAVERGLEALGDGGLGQIRAGLLSIRAGLRALLWADTDAAREDVAACVEAGPASTTTSHLLGAAALFDGEPDWSLPLLEAVDAADAARDILNQFTAGQTLVWGRYFTGDIDGAEADGACLLARARADGLRSWEATFRAVLACNRVFTRLGDDAVIAELEALLLDPAVTDNRHGVAGVLAMALADRGEVRRADAALMAGRSYPGADGSLAKLSLDWCEAEVAWAAGDLDRAARLASAALASDLVVQPSRTGAAVVGCWAAFERGEAVLLPDAVTPFPVFAGWPVEASAVEALAGGPDLVDKAVRLFDEAAELHGCYLRRSAQRCRWGAGEALRRAGAVDEAVSRWVPLLDDAVATKQAQLAERVRRSLRSVGTRSVHGVAEPAVAPGQVTARQGQILGLVQEGLTSEQIAERLHLSVQTVDTHIRNAMRRLGAGSRHEAARRVVRGR